MKYSQMIIEKCQNEKLIEIISEKLNESPLISHRFFNNLRYSSMGNIVFAKISLFFATTSIN